MSSKRFITIEVPGEDEEGEFTEEVKIPVVYEVCDRCHGHGTHDHPDIGGNGITSSEWAELCDGDDEFAENYFAGRYDVVCSECHGDRVVAVPDYEQLPADIRERLEAKEKADAEYARCRAYELKYGY